MQKLACVIMASGEGKRFGSNKLLADFKGEMLINRILKASNIEDLNRLVVTRTKEVHELANSLGIKSILHDKSFKSDTIRIAVENLSKYTQIMFCTADQALLKKESIETMIALSKENPEKIIRAGTEKHPGSPVIFPCSCFTELSKLSGDEGGKTVIQNHLDMVMYCELPELELMDIDTPDDLTHLLSLIEN